MGHAPKIINILFKPILEGFKIWILVNKGYILNFIWHAKGNKKGLVDLDQFFTKKGFLKTQAVILNFLNQQDNVTKERLYPLKKHIIWLNNLFISVKLFIRL